MNLLDSTTKSLENSWLEHTHTQLRTTPSSTECLYPRINNSTFQHILYVEFFMLGYIVCSHYVRSCVNPTDRSPPRSTKDFYEQCTSTELSELHALAGKLNFLCHAVLPPACLVESKMQQWTSDLRFHYLVTQTTTGAR